MCRLEFFWGNWSPNIMLSCWEIHNTTFANRASSIQDRLDCLICLGLVHVNHHVVGDDQHGWKQIPILFFDYFSKDGGMKHLQISEIYHLHLCYPPVVLHKDKTWLSSLYSKLTGRIILTLKSWIIFIISKVRTAMVV